MKPHEQLFKNQDQRPTETSSTKVKQMYIGFRYQGGQYALPITALREITDEYAIAPYPEPMDSHVGIVSLRGRVLPVINPRLSGEVAKPRSQKGSKLLVVEFVDSHSFCLEVFQIIKFVAELKDSEQNTAMILNVKNQPIRVLSKADFSAKAVGG